jgi:hypothetical protein
MIEQQISIDDEAQIIRKLFHTTIGIKINSEEPGVYADETKTFLDGLIQFKSLALVRYSEDIRQFHLLYVLGLLYQDYNNKVLKMDKLEFNNSIYYPNLINVISTVFDQCKYLIRKQFKEVYKEVYEASKEVVDFYLVFYSTEPTIIESDIISKFIKGPFLEEDPLNKSNISRDYIYYFRFLLYSYLQNRTANILSFDLDPSILEDDSIMSISSRYKIYEKGLKISHIQQLCKGSETLAIISNNYDHILKNIMDNKEESIGTNYLQQKYHDTVDDSKIKDNKILVLKSSTESYNLNKIKQKLPLVHKLLRSVHVDSSISSVILDSDKELLYNTIYDVVYNTYKDNLMEFSVKVEAKRTAIALTKSLTNGYFIDPYTMTKIDITGCLFSRQLKKFLEILFGNMGM